MPSKTIVINFIGGPGCRKSTMAADMYAVMKRKRMSVELVREVAKEWAIEGRKIGPFEQLSILGEQIQRESSLYTKVKYIVTDSPVVLGAFYFDHNHKQTFANEMIRAYYDFANRHGVQFKNIFLPRREDYDPEGRYETKEEAMHLDKAIFDYLSLHRYDMRVFTENNTDEEIIKIVMETL